MTDRLSRGRVQVEDPALAGRLQTYARPVNTAVIARQPDENTLSRLYNTLKDIEPTLQQALDMRQKRIQDDEAQQALQAVMSGQAPPEDSSKFLLKTYHTLSGKVNGMEQFQSELMTAYAEAGLPHSDDPAQFREFTQQFREQYLERYQDTNPDFLNGLMPMMDQTIQNLSAHHASVLGNNVSKGLISNFENEMAGTIRDLYNQGADPQQIAEVINQLNDRNLPILGGTKVNEIAIGVLAETAQSLGSADLLEALQYVRGGSGPLSKTRAGMTAIERAETQIYAKFIQRENQEWTRYQRERAAETEQAQMEINRALFENNGEMPLELLQKYAHIPGLMSSTYALRGAMLRDQETLDPQQIADARFRLISNPTMETVNQLVSEGLLIGEHEVKEAVDLATKAKENATVKAGITDPIFSNAYRELTNVFTEDGIFRSESLPALQMFQQEYLQWLGSEEGANSTPLKRAEVVNGMRERILRAYGFWDESLIPQGLRPQQPVGTDRQIVGGITSVAEFDRQLQEMAEGKSNPLSEALEEMGLDEHDGMAFIANQRQILQRRELNTPKIPAVQSSPRGLKLEHPNMTGGALGDLLDLIAKGESQGDYDVVWDGSGTGKQVPLRGMSIGEVLAFQRKHVNTDGYASSAAGRYQFTRPTLEALVKKHKIPLDQPFNEHMQDALAILLMAEVGLDRFLAGTMTPDAFISRLAGQWAALPKEASGTGAHDGDGLNAANVRWNDVLTRVNNIRALTTQQ